MTEQAMKHWPIIFALCRVAIGTQSPAARKQVERLRDAFTDDIDDDAKAQSLTSLLDATRVESNPMTHSDLTAADLKLMMRDPRYWRDQEPGIVNTVREGFRKLYEPKP